MFFVKRRQKQRQYWQLQQATIADSTSTLPSSSPVEPTDGVAGQETTPLSRLRQFTARNSTSNNQLSLSLRKQYESTADSVKNLLISDLKSRSDTNVEAMVDLANYFFTSLDFLHAEYSDLYDAVRDFLSHNYQYSLAKSELERNKNDIRSHENIIAREKAEAEALGKADTDLSIATNRVSTISSRICETRELLKKLEEEKVEVESEFDVLKVRYDLCIRSKAIMDKSVEQVDNKRKILEQIKGRCSNAEAGMLNSLSRMDVIFSAHTVPASVQKINLG